MTATAPLTLRLTRLLPASPAEVFDAWTDPESLRHWMCPGAICEAIAELDVRVGGRFRIVMRGPAGDVVHSGEYLEVDRPRRLVFTWISVNTHGRPTVVTVELRPVGDDRTELVLLHAGLPDEEAAARHRGGWSDILVKLERHVNRPVTEA